MLLIMWLVLCVVAGSLILLLPLYLWRHEIFKRYSGSRLVACPKDEHSAVVHIDERHAAATGIDGTPDLRLSECTLWPERSQCGQECLSQAVQTEPYTPGKVTAGKKQIYHIPILLAAFVAWCLGIIWHSHYMFRAEWTNAVGLTHAQVKQIVWWISPHLLTAAVCLLFAYGVASLLAVSHRKGILPGVLMAVLLCGALVATSWYGIDRLPRELLLIEAGYVVLAALIVGAIVGGLYGKLVLRPH